MKQFIAKFSDKVDGILCGFDRLVMRENCARCTSLRAEESNST